jgi:hypothetical protein
MGLNILVQKLDGTPHPAWDDSRHAGDRDLGPMLDAVPWQHEPGYDPWRKGDAPMFRPADLDAFDRGPWPEVNPERWEQLRRIMREEPDYWLYWSV